MENEKKDDEGNHEENCKRNLIRDVFNKKIWDIGPNFLDPVLRSPPSLLNLGYMFFVYGFSMIINSESKIETVILNNENRPILCDV